ncbi:MAG TPA: sugar ABC transporter substrate-binding protein [Thermoanaerobaculia bacterium]|nr:sugar ABC transporter substrate-binding protein [Thermoanaerobaculia bacterium]
MWAFGREGEVVQELMPEFERRHPGVRVRAQMVPWTAAHEKLLTAFVGESTPDLAQIGNSWIPELVAVGALERLDPWIAASPTVDPEGYFPGIWDTNVIDGGVYGIPWYVDTRVLFYRTDLLAAAGVTVMPTTWAGWRQAMEKVAARQGAKRYAILLPTDEWAQPIALGLQTGSAMLRDGGGRGAFSAPEFRRAFDFYLGIFRDGLAPVSNNTQIANIFQQFAGGDFAMYITGPWNVSEFRKRLPPEMRDRWMTAPLPGPDGPGVSLAGGSSLSVFSRSEHPKEAWALIEYLSEPAQQVRFYELSSDLPARREAWDDPVLANDLHVRAFWEQLQRVRATPKVPEWEQIVTKVYEHADAAIRGRVTGDEALADLDREVDRILEKRRFLLARQKEES